MTACESPVLQVGSIIEPGRSFVAWRITSVLPKNLSLDGDLCPEPAGQQRPILGDRLRSGLRPGCFSCCLPASPRGAALHAPTRVGAGRRAPPRGTNGGACTSPYER